MRTTKILQLLAVPLVAFLAMGSHCPLIPEIQKRIVELAVGGSTSVEFYAQGLINTIDQTQTVDVRGDINILQLVEDAGVNISDVKDIKLSGVSYKVTKLDPSIDRQIQGGTVTIGRSSGPTVPNTALVTNFNEGVNFVTTYKTANLDPAGVTLINALLTDLLTEAQGGTPTLNTFLSYRIQGQSVPGDEDTDFKWRIKIDVSIVGTVEVDVVD